MGPKSSSDACLYVCVKASRGSTGADMRTPLQNFDIAHVEAYLAKTLKITLRTTHVLESQILEFVLFVSLHKLLIS